MVEEMKFIRREKTKNAWRIGIISISAFILVMGYFWMGGKSIIGLLETSEFDKNLITAIGTIICLLLTSLSLGVVAYCVGYLCKASEGCMRKNISEYQFNAKIDKFLDYLGNSEIQLKLKSLANNMTPEFESAILNPELTYYVRKKDIENIEILIHKENEKISSWNTDCYFLFKHFEPIYENTVEKKEDNVEQV